MTAWPGAACVVSVVAILSWSMGTAGEQRVSAATADRLRVQVVRTYSHDSAAFTQGLLLHGGRLYESTGLVGQSSLREVEVETGRVVRRIDVAPPIFAEGLTLFGETLIQLTWQNGRALLYDRQSFRKQGELAYQGEGWGICTASDQVVMSNGSSALTFRSPKDFKVQRTVTVTLDGRPLDRLNELECVEGAIYANVWMQDVIVRIDPASGRVTARIDASSLLSPPERQNPDQVLNGIAYDAGDRTFLITGKLWPRLFRVRFVK